VKNAGEIGGADRGVFFGAARESGSHQKSVRGDGQCGVVMKATPVTFFVVAQAKFLLQFLVVALDAPAQLDQADECLERKALR